MFLRFAVALAIAVLFLLGSRAAPAAPLTLTIEQPAPASYPGGCMPPAIVLGLLLFLLLYAGVV